MSDLGPSPTEGGNSAYTELLMAAATEVCVHLGRVSAARRPERNLHAPARRAARTMVGIIGVLPTTGQSMSHHRL